MEEFVGKVDGEELVEVDPTEVASHFWDGLVDGDDLRGGINEIYGVGPGPPGDNVPD